MLVMMCAAVAGILIVVIGASGNVVSMTRPLVTVTASEIEPSIAMLPPIVKAPSMTK